MNTETKTAWYVYMVRCADQTLYTGISTDVARRVLEHNQSPKAAAYTRSRRPVELVYVEQCADRPAALRREHTIRQLTAQAKKNLIKNNCL